MPLSSRPSAASAPSPALPPHRAPVSFPSGKTGSFGILGGGPQFDNQFRHVARLRWVSSSPFRSQTLAGSRRCLRSRAACGTGKAAFPCVPRWPAIMGRQVRRPSLCPCRARYLEIRGDATQINLLGRRKRSVSKAGGRRREARRRVRHRQDFVPGFASLPRSVSAAVRSSKNSS